MKPIKRLVEVSLHLGEKVFRRDAIRRAARCKNFLVPQFQTALGTVVHATPLISALRRALPDANIVVAGSALAKQVYASNPQISGFVDIPSPLADFKAAVRAARASRFFDGEPYTTLLTTGNERSRIVLWATLAGASRRVGFSVQSEFVHKHLRFRESASQISNNLCLLPAAGLAGPKSAEPAIYVTTKDMEAAERRLQQLGSAPGRRRIAMVTQTSPTQRKSWPEERFAELSRCLIDEGADLIFVGTDAEVSAINKLRGLIGMPTLSIAGQTTIQELAAVFTCCDMGVTLDTGPLHVGRAVGLPMVIIAPAWSPVQEWLPVSDPRYRILKNADMRTAPLDYVIDEVTLDEVLAAATHLLIHEASAQRDYRLRFSSR